MSAAQIARADLKPGVTKLQHRDPLVAYRYGRPGVFVGFHDFCGDVMVVDCGTTYPVAAHLAHWEIFDASDPAAA